MLADALLARARAAGATHEQMQVLQAWINGAQVVSELGLGSEWRWLAEPRFRFVDLFAGIGGMRLAAESADATHLHVHIRLAGLDVRVEEEADLRAALFP